MNQKLRRLKNYMDKHKLIVKSLFSVIIFFICFTIVQLIFNSNALMDFIDSIIISQFITYMVYIELHDYLEKLEKESA